MLIVVLLPPPSLVVIDVVVVVRRHHRSSSSLSLFVVIVVRRHRCSLSLLFVVVIVRRRRHRSTLSSLLGLMFLFLAFPPSHLLSAPLRSAPQILPETQDPGSAGHGGEVDAETSGRRWRNWRCQRGPTSHACGSTWCPPFRL